MNVDLWGSATVNNKGEVLKCHVMTMMVTGWFEVAVLKAGPTALECQRLLDAYWLCRYPRPSEIGFDNGSEFKAEFLELAANMGMKTHASTSFNPQGNSVLERIHQVFGNNLRAFNLNEVDLHPEDPWEEFITATAYAL